MTTAVAAAAAVVPSARATVLPSLLQAHLVQHAAKLQTL